MKRFLIVTLILLVLALVAVVLVYFYVSSQLSATDASVPSEEGSAQVTIEVEPGSIPLKDVPLGDGQKKVLDAVGVDVENFVITSAMQTCAEEKLGSARVAEIVAGAAPDVIETGRLLPCIGAE